MTPAQTLARESAKARRGALEARMALQLRAVGLKPEAEFKFHPTRAWRLDFALPAHRIALEVDGGTHSGGRHVRGPGFEADCAKQAEAVMLGWRYLRATAAQVKSGEALRWVQTLIGVSA